MNSTSKYYLYVSDTKVDMLFSLVPQNLLKKIAAELNINLQFGIASVGATIKQNPSVETRYSKLRLVVEYVEKHLSVGSVDTPEAYIKGTLPMRWGLYPDSVKPAMVYFGGYSSRAVFGLAGSPQHIIGNKGSSSMEYISPSALVALLPLIAKIYTSESDPSFSSMRPEDFENKNPLPMIRYITANMRAPTLQLEFLAKKFLQGQEGTQNILLGSPIYVALAE
jgi:hypothetical protein